MLAQHRLFTVGEVALLLRQSPRSVRDKIAAGQMQAVRLGPARNAPIRIEERALERFLEEGKTP